MAGGALAGVIVAFLSAFENTKAGLQTVNAEHALKEELGAEGYKWLGVLFFALLAFILYKIATSRVKESEQIDLRE